MAAFEVALADVGDGLCASIGNLGEQSLIVDCGSSNNPRRACEGLVGPHLRHHLYADSVSFLLSHFHLDHYNGLVSAFRHPDPTVGSLLEHVDLDHVFYPGLPTRPEPDLWRRFLVARLSVNEFLLGNHSGVMAFDFIAVVRRLFPRRSFTRMPLRRGDRFPVGRRHFEVIWPPRETDDPSLIDSVRKAIAAFDEAAEAHPALAKIRDWVRERGVVEAYVQEGPIQEEGSTQREGMVDLGLGPLEGSAEPIPAEVATANVRLRDAANRLSLAFYYDDRILVLGDLENADINRALDGVDRSRFDVILPAHHGTHWHKRMRNVRAEYLLVSHGRKMARHFDERWKRIANQTLGTLTNGGINVSDVFANRFGPKCGRWHPHWGLHGHYW